MPIAQAILPAPIEDEMKESYLNYAMSVIVSRALPDVRDGLKPVHRRILYTMDELSLAPNKPHRKCAKTVGDVIGKYHPHGDIAVYDALVRMAQDFSMRYPLVDGHGNFGSVDGDPPAAYRYTEARLTPLALQLLEDLDKETVNFVPNFDNSEQEPTILPAKFPNLLVNGSSGIAVGMATNIPPHNLVEIIDAATAVIDDPNLDHKALLQYVKGPDFPTGGLIMGQAGIFNYFTTGRGSITMRAKTHMEDRKGNRESIIIDEIPYQVNKARMIEQIAELVRDKKITGISDLRDESDRNGMRVVIELKGDAVSQVVLNQLYKHSQLQTNFGVILLALVDGQPKVLTLREMIDEYVKHRQEVVNRRSAFELRKAEERAHLLEGLKIALDHLDEVIKTIRSSKDTETARLRLKENFSLSEAQANGILDMRLSRLTALERQKIDEEHKELLKTIDYLKNLLESPRKILGVIKKELKEIKDKFGDERKTEISLTGPGIFNIEELITEEQIVVTITHTGYIKRLPMNTYRNQRRGGRGIMGLSMKAEDFTEHLFTTTTHYYLLFFTTQGKVFRLKSYEIPEAGRQAKGTALVNLIPIQPGEKITAIFPVKDFDSNHFLIMSTAGGMVKKTPLDEYANIFKTGIQGIILGEGDELIGVELTDGNQEIILGTKSGLAIRFNEKEARAMGRRTRGVRGVRFKGKDAVVAMDNLRDKTELLVVTSLGYGKVSPLSLYRVQGRGGKGIKTFKSTAKNGFIVAVRAVREDDEIMIITKEGIVIRMRLQDISRQGRSTQGVRVIRLDSGDAVTAIAVIPKEAREDDEESAIPLAKPEAAELEGEEEREGD